MVLGAMLLSGCGTATFSNSSAVAVESRQQVSVFDTAMGDSAQWAGAHDWSGCTGAPYTTRIFATDTKFVLDSSLPESVVGLFLPQVTQTGYFAIDLPGDQADIDAPFVAWYSEDPSEPPSAQPLRLDVAAGLDGGYINWTFGMRLTGRIVFAIRAAAELAGRDEYAARPDRPGAVIFPPTTGDPGLVGICVGRGSSGPVAAGWVDIDCPAR